MAEGNEPRPLPYRNWETIIIGTNLTTTETIYNTYNSRKFSDYDLLIFTIGGSADDIRGTNVIQSWWWMNGRKILMAIMHGSSLENRCSVDITYNSDTSIKARVGNSGLINYLQVFGGFIR